MILLIGEESGCLTQECSLAIAAFGLLAWLFLGHSGVQADTGVGQPEKSWVPGPM